jgi:hypothetical protein
VSDAVREFFERFNDGDIDGLAGLLAPGYDYAEPVLGGVVDADGHLAAMRQYLDFIPDRRFEIGDRRPTPGGVALECRYVGTRAADGEQINVPVTIVFDLDNEGRRITRLRSYYELTG